MKTLITAIRFLAVTVLYFGTFAVVSGLLLAGSSAPPPDPESAGTTLLALLAISLLNAAVFGYVILRSGWTGWKLILSMVLVFYGVNTLMPQIETAFFVNTLPPGMLSRLFVAGFIIAAVFCPLAVLILGKARSKTGSALEDSWPKHSITGWIARLALVVVLYLLVYFGFGYYVAWQSPAVRSYYGGQDPGSFVAQIRSVLRDQPLLFVLQAGRALLWTSIAIPIIRMMKGKRWETPLAVALVFAVTASQLLLPNPLMPYEVRMAHLLETTTSNFLFGLLVVVILRSSTDSTDSSIISV